MKIIETDDDVAQGTDWLARTDPRFVPILAATGPLPLRRKPDGFATILDAITSQQVSVASAAAIWARLQAANLTEQHRVAAATEDDLRACGLSRPKIRYALAIARTDLDWSALRHLPDAKVTAHLTALPGIGQWTAEIYLLSALGRADIFPAGDLALQEAARIAFDLPDRPSERPMRQMAEAWSPWRAVAARALWAYYRVHKNREGIK